MAGTYLKMVQEQREKQMGPGQNSPDQINRKRGHMHFLKTRKLADRPVSEAEDLQMGQLLAEREAKYYSLDSLVTLSWEELNVRQHAAEIEADALVLEGSLSAKLRKNLHSRQRAETFHMIHSEAESKDREECDETILLGMQTVQTLSTPPAPMFQNGSNIIQWWAPWMATAAGPLRTFANKNRPAWFKGECLQHLGWMSTFYAGRHQPTGHVYSVLCWNGTVEEVSEHFLQPRLARHSHSAGRLLNNVQENPPDFWTHLNEGWTMQQ